MIENNFIKALNAINVSFLLVVKDVTNLLRVMEISVIMVVHARLLLKLILSWV